MQILYITFTKRKCQLPFFIDSFGQSSPCSFGCCLKCMVGDFPGRYLCTSTRVHLSQKRMRWRRIEPSQEGSSQGRPFGKPPADQRKWHPPINKNQLFQKSSITVFDKLFNWKHWWGWSTPVLCHLCHGVSFPVKFNGTLEFIASSMGFNNPGVLWKRLVAVCQKHEQRAIFNCH